MALSAAELQKRHQLEGAPDPFPTLGGAPSPARPAVAASSRTATPPAGGFDAASEDAFPSLGASAAAPVNISKPAISAWSAKPATVKAGAAKKGWAPGGLGRAGQATSASHPYTETFSIPAAELATGKAAQETMKKVQEQTGAVVESSTQMSTGLKQFHVKAADPKRLALARQLIERGLSKPVVLEVEVPITTIGTIIGPKGATLKSITDATSTKIDIPRRDSLPEWNPAPANGGADSDDEDEGPEEPQVTITISGTSAAAADARDRLLGLISHKISQGSASIKNIPSKYYPFISGPRRANIKKLEEELGAGEVTIHVPPPSVWRAIQNDDEDDDEAPKDRDLAIKLKGNKEKIKLIQAEIQRQFEDLVVSLKEFGIVVPKRQHRYLIGDAADDILEQTGCIIDLPPANDPNEQVTMRGPQAGLLKAIELAMSKAGAVAVETVDVVALARLNSSDPVPHAKKVARFLQRSGRLKAIAANHGVQVYAPRATVLATSDKVVIEAVGEDQAAVVKARDEVANAIKAVPPAAITTVQIDPAVHSVLIGKKAARIGQFETANKVTAIFPSADEDSADVHIIYSGTDALPGDKKGRDAKLKEIVGAASEALLGLAKSAADVKTETIDVDKKWHRAVIGQGGSVLNALIGEDGLVNIRVGAGKDAKSGANEDVVVVRGPSEDVDRVVASIKQIVEDAKNDDIINGYTAEFDVDKKYVAHLVGASGSAINKLRDSLGVKVNFDDDDEGKKTKKALTHCKIVGRKEAVEEAKRRIQAQIEKLEDETTEVVKIKREIQPALIGSGGKYAIRLEEKYGVKLSFPRDNKDKDSKDAKDAKSDEVTIRGGKKGVAAAKAELLEAAAFEVPSKAVAMIVGKQGATINGIKDDTGAQIDIDKSAGKDDKTTITVRGDKKAIAAAKAAVLAVVEELGDEITINLTIDRKHHRTLIGQGGQKLRDLIAASGGPAEGHKQAGLVTFPRQGDANTDNVVLRGDSKVVKKIQAELEKQVDVLKKTVTIGVSVPAAQHASKIGRGGSALQDLQRKTNTAVHFPGSRQYNQIGEVDNADELEGVEAGDIVKVVGTKEAVAQAAELLQVASPERGTQNRGGRGGNADLATREVSIPVKYYHAVAEQPNLIRQIRSANAFLTIPTPAPAKPVHVPSANGDSIAAKTARIDLDAEDEPVEGEWEIRANYEGAGDEALSWVVRAKEEDLDKAVAVLDKAVKQAESASHVGLLTGLPRAAFPRIIGSKGATISRLRAETGTDINVGKENDLITITGSESSVLAAKEAILSVVTRSGSRF
ncbi:hypothetical protein VHUM_02379 [Vanrija humicola]|uniref:K Homology domain-containing protein n=1 Tax=Vanrija humicola TaxID=5417 RepID=A0A7D8V1S2_VANHU|nr:hypothetical protein VHUM_02379 [Vanrija humicola]